MAYKPTNAVTVLDVSRRSGLSTATVSRVLNGSNSVREETRTRVMDAVRELRYTINHAARTLARQRTDNIVAVLPAMNTGFFTNVLMGVHQVTDEENYHLAVAFSQNHRDKESLVESYLDSGRVDALILMNLGTSEKFIQRIADADRPIVLIDSPVAGADVSLVRIDNQAGAAAAIHHLVEVGHRRIALITGPDDNYDSQERLAGCRSAARDAGIELDPDLIWPGTFFDTSGHEAMVRYLRTGAELPDAIFAFNDAMAIGAINALRLRNLDVPGDVALVGFDDVESAKYLGLTTVRSPMIEMGEAAAQMTLELLNNEDAAHQERVLSTELVVRESSLPRKTGAAS